ncbi:hypothetical protein BDB00DRAFT_836567 [Zychaea mexicana]|uniref:uncharacterized protein n=1 Tax=Zychaea mexicana TaxID=64656 RepID=UPI0022FF3022|nr:uncharacterized protein BDB00DRAFT_836567 [Zychaea mexicana]KAI9490746.1 hypothetical protein BDB00DRAFT_836567 [Zychaea mexicana]
MITIARGVQDQSRMSKPTNLSRDARKGHEIKPIQCLNVDALNDTWQCPFCVPPPFVLQLPSKDDLILMGRFRRQISEHLQIHKQDVIKAIGEKVKSKASKTDREKRTMQWIDATVNDIK